MLELVQITHIIRFFNFNTGNEILLSIDFGKFFINQKKRIIAIIYAIS
uniref:ABC transporter ATP-binding protein n=1 Tax=Ascaris lumbricoides TaxID=6252 RepID=A0A0M3IVV7_ASCLU